MFSALGLFKDIPCPKEYSCTLSNCIFLHAGGRTEPTRHGGSEVIEYDPLSAGAEASPPRKKRRVEPPATTSTDNAISASIPSNGEKRCVHAFETKVRETTNSSKLVHKSPGSTTTTEPTSKAANRVQPQVTRKQPILKTVERPVSPPPLEKKQPLLPQSIRSGVSKESLVPRNVSNAPATLSTRLAVLKSLHQQLIAQNQKLSKEDEKWKSLVLNDQELILFALDEEERHALDFSADIYRNAMAQRILRLKKMGSEDWRQELSTRMSRNKVADGQKPQVEANPKLVSTGLRSEQEEMSILKLLQTPLGGLEKYGYVLTKPSDKDIADANRVSEAMGGFEVCDRCSTRFQVFPGRDDQGRLTTRGPCRYHWSRLERFQGARSEKVIGSTTATFPCCNQAQGSEGCTEAETHVFKVNDVKRLASILQFEETPSSPTTHDAKPISFDCEMVYTTLGMEMARLTAVSWPKGELLIDVLVRPYGEILDFNTRFSGISKQQYTVANPYERSSTDSVSAQTLQKVDSIAAARDLLFTFINPETPLIGHAIENDLNVCRIIHPTVIDTVLLYPHPRGLPIRYGLKMLTTKYLSRTIQIQGEQGHDSKEDAVATGDLVTLAVADKWRTMKLSGWKFSQGELVAPEASQHKPVHKAAL